jgi:hypothetical protein
MVVAGGASWGDSGWMASAMCDLEFYGLGGILTTLRALAPLELQLTELRILPTGLPRVGIAF